MHIVNIQQNRRVWWTTSTAVPFFTSSGETHALCLFACLCICNCTKHIYSFAPYCYTFTFLYINVHGKKDVALRHSLPLETYKWQMLLPTQLCNSLSFLIMFTKTLHLLLSNKQDKNSDVCELHKNDSKSTFWKQKNRTLKWNTEWVQNTVQSSYFTYHIFLYRNKSVIQLKSKDSKFLQWWKCELWYSGM